MKIIAGNTVFGEPGGPRPATPEELAEVDAIVAAMSDPEPDQTDLGAFDDRPLGADHPVYRSGSL